MKKMGLFDRKREPVAHKKGRGGKTWISHQSVAASRHRQSFELMLQAIAATKVSIPENPELQTQKQNWASRALCILQLKKNSDSLEILPTTQSILERKGGRRDCREKQSLCVKWGSERKKNTHVCNWLTFFWVYRHCNRFFQLLLHHPRSTKTLISIFSRVCLSRFCLFARRDNNNSSRGRRRRTLP